jgi:hypothetical protein
MIQSGFSRGFTWMDEYKHSSDNDERSRIWKRIEEISGEWNSLPPAVADAIFILRHEKIGRWESSNWCWADDPEYDPLAKSLVEGKQDQKKQDALYVRLGSDGQVAVTPSQVRHDDAKAEIESAKRMRFFVEYMVKGNTGGVEYDKIESSFRTVFATLEKDDAEALGVYSRFLHTTTAPAVTAIITTSRTISAQLIVDLLYEHH